MLEAKLPGATADGVVQRSLAAARSLILEQTDRAPAPGRPTGRSLPQDAQDILERLAEAEALPTTAAARADQTPLSGAQLVSLMWQSFANPAAQKPWQDHRPAAHERAADVGLRQQQWRREWIDSMASCYQAHGQPLPLLAIVERLVSQMPVHLRSHREAEWAPLPHMADADEVWADTEREWTRLAPRMGAPSAEVVAAAPDLGRWWSQLYAGSCAARADRFWGSLHDPQRGHFLASCQEALLRLTGLQPILLPAGK